jgi:hypothetical protein
MRIVEVNVVLGQKKTWTYSLTSKTLQCIGCASHTGNVCFPRRCSGAKGERQVIFLMDQSMPAIFPSETEKGCIKIIRLETDMLRELAEGLVALLSGRQVAPGSTVLLTSACNMAAVS